MIWIQPLLLSETVDKFAHFGSFQGSASPGSVSSVIAIGTVNQKLHKGKLQSNKVINLGQSKGLLGQNVYFMHSYLNCTVLRRSTRWPSSSRGRAAASFPTFPLTTWLWIDNILFIPLEPESVIFRALTHGMLYNYLVTSIFWLIIFSVIKKVLKSLSLLVILKEWHASSKNVDKYWLWMLLILFFVKKSVFRKDKILNSKKVEIYSNRLQTRERRK